MDDSTHLRAYQKLKSLDDDTLSELLRLAEERLRAQLELVVASNQRSTALATVMATLLIAVASGASIAFKLEYDTISIMLGIVSAGLFFGLVFSVQAAMPQPISPSGVRFSSWNDLSTLENKKDLLAQIGAVYGQSLEENSILIETSMKKLRIAHNLLWYGVALSAVYSLFTVIFAYI